MKKKTSVRKSALRTFRPRLESLETRVMPTTYNVLNLADAGPGSLRAAITSVDADNTNGSNTPDVIDFSVAGVIKLTSGALPTITNTVKIDGTSAPGFTDAPVVEIDNNGFAGLTINAPNSTLASLSIVDANGAGVTLPGDNGLIPSGANGHTLVGNYIGLALDGSVAPNTGVGVFVDGSAGGIIGGTTSLDRNVISGNGGGGIEAGPGAVAQLSETIEGNFIGTDPSGQAAAPNQGNGITVFSGVGPRFGGGSTIGGTNPGDGNTIAFNSQYGIVVDTGEGNVISENSIFSNGAGGILLKNNGNNNVPAPVLTAAFPPTPTTIEVSGTLVIPHFLPAQNSNYVVEIFATPSGTPAGQGQNFIGSLTVVPNADGIAPFIFHASFASASGTSFTATATGGGPLGGPGGTSAFSPALALGGNANSAYVGSVYGLLLHRAPDASGGPYWANALTSGTLTPAGFVRAIEASGEYIADQVDALYLRYLQRAADPTGQQFWVSFVQSGGTFEQVGEAMVSTQTYYVLHGGTDQEFITGLYADILNRSPSTAELAAWETVLNSGASRVSVATAFFSSYEYRTELVQNDYMTFLNRAADSAGLNYWVNALAAGYTDQDVLAWIFGSPAGYQLWS